MMNLPAPPNAPCSPTSLASAKGWVRIRSPGPGSAYCLEVPVDSVDVLRFGHHLDEGRIEEALAEWKGTPLAGLDAPGLDATISGLTERWLQAVELDLERRVETDPAGDHWATDGTHNQLPLP